MIGAQGNGPTAGDAYILFGGATGFASSAASLNGSNGFRITGEGDTNFGYAVASVGDINNDGYDDLGFASTGNASSGSLGAAYIMFGKAGGFSASINATALTGDVGFKVVPTTDDHKRVSFASADVNGDGIDDLIMGMRYADIGATNTGAVYVVYGTSSGFGDTLSVGSLNGANGFRISGLAFTDSLGNSVSNAGDVNGDGFDDLILGAPYADDGGSNSGTVYVVYGAASGIPSSINLATMTADQGFKIVGPSASAFVGFTVAGIGDINNDGLDDMALRGSSLGPVYVIYGQWVTRNFAGTVGDDNYTALGGDDTLYGLAGKDILRGAGGADFIYGGDGNDVLYGDAGNDTIDGGELSDQLFGGLGADTLNGNDGDDTIIGGAGNDLLRGGSGADTFRVLQESLGGAALETDQIFDFSAAEGDRIDLSAIDANTRVDGNQAFRLVSAFTRPDNDHLSDIGQMTLTFAGGITTLRLDVNGDGRVDYQMKINGDLAAESGGWLL